LLKGFWLAIINEFKYLSVLLQNKFLSIIIITEKSTWAEISFFFLNFGGFDLFLGSGRGLLRRTSSWGTLSWGASSEAHAANLFETSGNNLNYFFTTWISFPFKEFTTFDSFSASTSTPTEVRIFFKSSADGEAFPDRAAKQYAARYFILNLNLFIKSSKKFMIFNDFIN